MVAGGIWDLGFLQTGLRERLRRRACKTHSDYRYAPMVTIRVTVLLAASWRA